MNKKIRYLMLAVLLVQTVIGAHRQTPRRTTAKKLVVRILSITASLPLGGEAVAILRRSHTVFTDKTATEVGGITDANGHGDVGQRAVGGL